MDDSIDGLHGKPNSTRIIVYENKYDEDGLLIGMTARSEIIYCKDCKNYIADGVMVCDRFMDASLKPNDFCSYGEEKSDGRRYD